MAQTTHIEWADSTLNLQMGCDGCELWNPKAGIKHCYAGTLTDRYAGRKGYPNSFGEPKLFLERLAPALKWPDLTGKDRPDKPWLSGRPRMIFLNDMGDTFTESLPLDWLAPLLPQMAESPHVWMLLTKRGKRMREFSEAHPLPANVWPGVSVTSKISLGRVDQLLQVKGDNLTRWLSVEPLLESVDLREHFNGDAAGRETGGPQGWQPGPGIDLVIVGGESGPGARPFEVDWARSLRDQCRAAGIAYFLKQMGSKPTGRAPTISGPACDPMTHDPDRLLTLTLKDKKGGDESAWPFDLQGCRAFPEVRA